MPWPQLPKGVSSNRMERPFAIYNERALHHVQSPLAQQETIAESKGAPVPHAFAAGGLGLHDQRLGTYPCRHTPAPSGQGLQRTAAN